MGHSLGLLFVGEALAFGVNGFLAFPFCSGLCLFSFLERFLESIFSILFGPCSSLSLLSVGLGFFLFSQGFESSMLAAVLLAALYFLRIGRIRLPVVLASLAPLIRPEGVLRKVIVSAYLLRARRCNARLLLCYLPIPLLWLAGATAFYGSPIPHAILAEKKFPMIHRPYADAEISLS